MGNACGKGHAALDRPRLWLAWAGVLLLIAIASVPWPALAQSKTSTDAAALTFGILPIGGPSESLDAWRPMLKDMSHALHEPVHSLSVSTYDGLAEAIAGGFNYEVQHLTN